MQTLSTHTPIYRTIASHLAQAIERGQLRAGDRMPSVRDLCVQFSVSPTTATQVYRHLETRLLIEAKPRSGYFVRKTKAPIPALEMTPLDHPTDGKLSTDLILQRFTAIMAQSEFQPFAAATPDRRMMPESKLSALIATLNRRKGFRAEYPSPAGSKGLRAEIARRLLTVGVAVSAEELLVTNGCMEALSIALRSVARPGDTIAVESPTYFSLLQTLDTLGMKALEIPTHPREGISIEALELATREKGKVTAVVVMPTFHNPLGCTMPDERKMQLAALASERGLPVIEDDIYGDLQHDGPRPWPVRAWDHSGWVLLCGSFSKTLAPSLRVGYLAAGRWREQALTLKYLSSIASPVLQQEVVAAFLCGGGYDHHLRKLRSTLKSNLDYFLTAMQEAFPEGCRCNRPSGGYILWVELPPDVDTRRLFDRAAAQGIAITPGALFSKTDRYESHIRLHAGMLWSEKIRESILRLGQLISEKSVHLRRA